jgi:hypothetical protein
MLTNIPATRLFKSRTITAFAGLSVDVRILFA